MHKSMRGAKHASQDLHSTVTFNFSMPTKAFFLNPYFYRLCDEITLYESLHCYVYFTKSYTLTSMAIWPIPRTLSKKKKRRQGPNHLPL